MSSNAAAEVGSNQESPNQEQSVSETPDQELPLPDNTELESQADNDNNTASAANAGNTTGGIQMGAIEGYAISPYNQAILEYKTSQGSHTEFLEIVNGTMNLSNVEIPSGSIVTVSILALYTQDGADQSVLYVDHDTMTIEQFQALSVWTIDNDAVEAPLDLSAYADWTNTDLIVVNGTHNQTTYIPNYKDLSILSKPGNVKLSFTGSKNRTGYLIHKTFALTSGAHLAFNEEDVSEAVTTRLPEGLDNTHLWGMDGFGYFGEIDNLVVTKGVYSLNVDQIEKRENGNHTTSWAINEFQVNGDRELRFGEPKLNIRSLDLSTKGIYAVVVVNNGDFQLENVYDHRDSESQQLTSTHVKITDSQNQSVYETDLNSRGWCCEDHTFDKPLAAGTYTIDFTVTGLEQPLSLSQTVILKDNSVYEGKGLAVHAENESGQPLSEAKAYVFEKRPYGGDGGTDAYWALNYQSKVSNDGSFIIPYQNLLKGRAYELQVIGSSADGQHEVVYNQAVSREDQEIQLKSSGLKHLRVNAAQASKNDSLLISVLDEQKQVSNWPILTLFDENRQAEIYIQNDNDIKLLAKLYNADNDTGYLLTGTADSAAHAVDLNGETAEIQMPAGFENAKLDVNVGWSASELPAKHYFVSKGLDIVASYFVEADGYRYTFNKSIDQVNRDITLEIGHDFVNRHTDNQLFASGELNRRVYTDYRDELDNTLVGVSYTETAQIADRVNSSNLTFTADYAGRQQVMSVQTSDEGGISYEPTDQPAGSNRTFTEGSIIDYQMHDASNQTIGGVVGTATPVQLYADMPIQEGDYSLRIANQHFPTDVVKLAGQANLSVIPGNETATRIPIALPPGYETGKIEYGDVRLQKLDGTSDYLWITQGRLIIPSYLNLVADQKYVLQMALHLKTLDGERAVYYNQLDLTGEQLLNLQQIDYPASAVTITPEVKDLPVNFQPYNIILEFPTAGIAGSSLMTNTIMNYFTGSKVSLGTIIMKPENFKIDLSGRNISTVYDIRREVHMDAGDGKYTLTDPGMHLVTLAGNKPFTSFSSISPGATSYSYQNYYPFILFNKAYVAPGKQQLLFGTQKTNAEEEPWDLYWMTRSTYDVKADTIIPFTGQVDPASSSLKLTQRNEQDITFLAVNPEFVSGDLILKDLYLGKTGNYDSVPGMVTIRDSQQKKVYESLAYGLYDGGFEVSKAFAAGTYSITYRQPVGPNEEAVVTNSFTVAAHDSGNPSSGGGSPGGGGGGTAVGDPTGDESTKSTTFKPSDIPAPVNGVVTLQIKDSESAVIPASILGGDGVKNELELTGSHGKVSIPPAVLKQLAGLVGNEKLADAQFALTMKPISENDLSDTVHAASGNRVNIAGTVYDFKLTITAKDGQPILLSAFEEPITLTFEVNEDADKHLANIYYIAEDGSIAYEPSQLINGMLVAKVNHFSQYGVLELHMSFTDVSESHWAHDAVQELAAKQIVEGVAPNTFAPGKTITRAEFTTMLVHALGLSVQETSAFKDVPNTAWYASTVAAAYQNHLIQGISAESFAPNKSISREEMAIILANALKLAKAAPETPEHAKAFKDAADISAWAADSVDYALANELIKGDESGLFKPKGMATRAEAAQMIVNLLNQLQS